MNVELIEYFGDDLMVANVARVSYNKESFELSDRDGRLINFLAKHGHTTPFRHPQLQFRIQCPIFVERQLFTHQIGWARNSISGRYVDFSDTYDYPKQLRFQSNDSKQGSSGPLPSDKNDYFLDRVKNLQEESEKLYKEMSDYGVAKEQCRIHLPLSLETKFIWTGSFQAFVHLCKLRIKPDAQQETKDVVKTMLDCVNSLEGDPFKYSLGAFDLCD